MVKTESEMLRIINGRVIDPINGTDRVLNIEIEGEHIKRVKETSFENDGTPEIDATGKYILPGFCDVHVHFRDPGFTHKEDIYTGAKAAVAGGYTDVVMMANTKPAIDNPETLEYVLKKGRETDINVHACGTVTKGLAGLELTDMAKLKELGAIGFTDDGIPLMDEELLRKAFETAKKLDVPISLHEEDKTLIKQNGINHGTVSEKLGIYGSPKEAESSLIARDVLLAMETGVKLNIQHISTMEGVELVRNIKKKCDNVYAEVTPHHLALTECAVLQYGVNAKMNPPLRTESDRQAIIEGVKDGTISMLATDHAPHAAEEKAKGLTEAPSGITGLETAFSVAYDELVLKGYIGLKQLVEMLTVNPRKLYGLEQVELKEGGRADLVIADLNENWVYDHTESKSKNTPFLGKSFTGKIKKTICKGKVVYEDI